MTREEFLGAIGAGIARLVLSTVRLRLVDRAGFTTVPPNFPVIITFWHNRILAITRTYQSRYHPSRKGVTVLTSPSRDGEILAQIMARFRMGAIRGSSSRRGSRALLECARWLESGGDLAVTPDGPKGPRYRMGPGLILLAQKTGARVMPVRARFSRCYEVPSWDGFRIPLPFSRIDVTIDPYETIPETTDDAAFEAERKRIEDLLNHEID